MRILKTLFLLLASACMLQASGQNRISVPADFPVAILDDMAGLLQLATGKHWSKTTDKDIPAGFLLKKQSAASFKTKESFRLQSNGSGKVTITASSNEGLVFGFYKHLRAIGFSFYLPGAEYTVIPRLAHPYGQQKDIVDKPLLQIRNFFGTGGYGTNNPDPDKSVEKDWEIWKTRNGFGNAYELAGHRGENFILENKDILQKNPQWLATPLQGNSQTDQSIKLDYTNKEGLNFFVDWTIQPLLQKSFVIPPPNHTELVSIEPSDGGGFLNDLPQYKNRKLPSVSDQVYLAANLAAQKLDKIFPNHPHIGVSLYAYSGHAAPPSFPLHPRVFVQLVPYQFQNIAYGPSFIQLWAQKAKRFGLYDYYNYTDAHYDLPGGLTLQEAMQRLVHSVKQGSEGSHYETSFSKFSTGIPLYILNRYMSDGREDWKKGLDQLVSTLYPESRAQVTKLFALFYESSQFNVGQLGAAVALLNEIKEADLSGAERFRIHELKQYLHYIHLVFQSRDAKGGTLSERFLPLATYAWKIYDQKIVHSYRIMQLASYAFLNAPKNGKDDGANYQLHLDWFPETERSKTKWGQIRQGYDQAAIAKDFAKLQQLYPATALPATATLEEVWNQVQQTHKPRTALVIGGNHHMRGYFNVYSPVKTELTIRYRLGGTAAKPQLVLSSLDGQYAAPTAKTIDQASGTYTVTLSPGETFFFINAATDVVYRMEISIRSGFIFFNSSPRGIMTFYRRFDDPADGYTYDPAYYPSYIYVPQGLKAIDYRVQLNALKLTAPGNKVKTSRVIQTESDFEVRKIELEPAERGRIWKASISGNYNYGLLNLPDRYLFLEEK